MTQVSDPYLQEVWSYQEKSQMTTNYFLVNFQSCVSSCESESSTRSKNERF